MIYIILLEQQRITDKHPGLYFEPVHPPKSNSSCYVWVDKMLTVDRMFEFKGEWNKYTNIDIKDWYLIICSTDWLKIFELILPDLLSSPISIKEKSYPINF